MIPRWQMGAARSLYGELIITDAKDTQLNRRTLTARLTEPTTDKDVTPCLKDAVVLYVNHNTIVITGFESTLDDRAVAQTWMLSLDEKFLHAMHWPARSA